MNLIRLTSTVLTDLVRGTTLSCTPLPVDDLGRTESVTSYDGSDPDSANVVNQVKFEYTDLGEISQLQQEPNGAVDTNSHTLLYTYSEVNESGLGPRRLESLTYDDGAEVNYGYGATGASDDRISRLRQISLDEPGGGAGPVVAIYDYIGLGRAVIVDQAEIDVQLDYTAASDGTRETAGEYPGFDRFGRVIRHPWVDSAFSSTIPEIETVNYTYLFEEPTFNGVDEGIDVLNLAARSRFRYSLADAAQSEYAHDGLNRLVENYRGERASGSIGDGYTGFTADASSRAWTLDPLGNWDVFETDYASGAYQDSEARAHNEANEITARDSGDATHDRVGNMLRNEARSGLIAILYTHDAWNRLVKVVLDPGGINPDSTRAEFEYNGLNWRTVKRSDPEADDGVLSQERLMYYTPGWQLIEEDVDDDFDDASADQRHVQYVWGSRYIDDIILRREDRSDGTGTLPDGDYQDAGDIERWYITDAQFSVIGVLDGAAGVVEWVSYTPYGVARHSPPTDLTGNGQVDSGDLFALLGEWGTGVLSPADLNRDGDVDYDDVTIVTGSYGTPTLASGRISSPYDSAIGGEDNQIGYDGYIHNAESELYTVRHRHYSPELGRWLERDPAGYVDGSLPYLYGLSMPLLRNDPTGLRTLQELYDHVLNLIETADSNGLHFAAKNLGWFIGNSGQDLVHSYFDIRTLQDFDPFKPIMKTKNPPVLSAEQRNKRRIINRTLVKYACTIGERQRGVLDDAWDARISLTDAISNSIDLYLGSGASLLRSRAKLQLTRQSGQVRVWGVVEHNWYDRYDWHPGKGKAYILLPSDAEMKRLANGGLATEFDMRANAWQTLSAMVDCCSYKPDIEEYEWGQLVDGRNSSFYLGAFAVPIPPAAIQPSQVGVRIVDQFFP